MVDGLPPVAHVYHYVCENHIVLVHQGCSASHLAVTWLAVYRQLHISVLPESNTGEGRIGSAPNP